MAWAELDRHVAGVYAPYIRLYDASRRARVDSDFFLVHVLTAQGIPRDRAAWLELFGRTELRCERVYTSAVARAAA